MAPTMRKATRSAVGRELTAKQVIVKHDEIRGSSRRIPRQQALELVRKFYPQGEVQIESTKKLSLECPCLHLECFDLRTYLQRHKQLTYWDCPVCDEKVYLERLRIDEYMTSILQAVPAGCLEVEILEDGSFNAIVANGSVDVVEITDEGRFAPQEREPKPVKEEPMDVAAVGTILVAEGKDEPVKAEPKDHASTNVKARPAKELTDEAKETTIYLAVRAHFEPSSVSEVQPRVTRCCLKKRSGYMYATLQKFLPRLPSKKYALPERLKSVIGFDMSGIKASNISLFKKRVEELNDFMSRKALLVLNAESGPGNICIVDCPRSGLGGSTDDRITCAGCTVSYHTKCLGFDGLDGLIEAYFCPKCEDETQTTEFRRAL